MSALPPARWLLNGDKPVRLHIAAVTHGARSVLHEEVRSEKRSLAIPARSADSVELLVITEPGGAYSVTTIFWADTYAGLEKLRQAYHAINRLLPQFKNPDL